MCQVWFHAFSVKSDQGSQRWPKGIAVYVNFSIPPSLVFTQVKKSLKITFSSISPYSHNISFSPSSLHFRPDFSLLLTFSGHFSPLPIVYLPPLCGGLDYGRHFESGAMNGTCFQDRIGFIKFSISPEFVPLLMDKDLLHKIFV